MLPHEAPEVGYVLQKFPALARPFVLDELLALEERGVRLHVFSLERPDDPRFSEDLVRLEARVTYLPGLAEVGRLLRHAGRARRGFGLRYWRTASWVLSRRSSELLLRFLQSTHLANWVQRLGVRHLHAQAASSPTTVTHMASRLTGVPFSFAVHGADLRHAPNRLVLGEKVDAAKWVVAPSDFHRSHLLRLTGASPEKVVVVRNGVRLERFTPGDPPPYPPLRMLCVARLPDRKGLTVLLDACARLKGWGLGFELAIVWKGKVQPRLEALIARHGLQAHVRVLGPRTPGEVLQLYRESHLCVFSAEADSDVGREGVPLSIIEALACGVPVVSSGVAGIPEAVHHGNNGLLVPPGDPVALAVTLESLIRKPWFYERLRLTARSSVAAPFDLPRSAALLQALLAGSEGVAEAEAGKPGWTLATALRSRNGRVELTLPTG